MHGNFFGTSMALPHQVIRTETDDDEGANDEQTIDREYREGTDQVKQRPQNKYQTTNNNQISQL